MKQTIDYSSFTDEKKKQQEAIKDIIAYTGQEYFDKVTAAMKAEPIELESFANMLAMMVGIEGYPVKAWHDHVYNTVDQPVDEGRTPAECHNKRERSR